MNSTFEELRGWNFQRKPEVPKTWEVLKQKNQTFHHLNFGFAISRSSTLEAFGIREFLQFWYFLNSWTSKLINS